MASPGEGQGNPPEGSPALAGLFERLLAAQAAQAAEAAQAAAQAQAENREAAQAAAQAVAQAQAENRLGFERLMRALGVLVEAVGGSKEPASGPFAPHVASPAATNMPPELGPGWTAQDEDVPSGSTFLESPPPATPAPSGRPQPLSDELPAAGRGAEGAAPTRGAAVLSYGSLPEGPSPTPQSSAPGRPVGPTGDARSVSGAATAPRFGGAPRSEQETPPLLSFRRSSGHDPGTRGTSVSRAVDPERIDARTLQLVQEGLKVTTSLGISGEEDAAAQPAQFRSELRSSLAQRVAALRSLMLQMSPDQIFPSVVTVPHWATSLGQLEYLLRHCRPGSTAHMLVQSRVLDAQSNHSADLDFLHRNLCVPALPNHELGVLSKPVAAVVAALEAVESERDSQLLNNLPSFLATGGGVDGTTLAALPAACSNFFNYVHVLRQSKIGISEPELSLSALVASFTDAASRNKALLGFGRALLDHLLRISSGYEQSAVLDTFPLQPGECRVLGSLNTFFLKPSELLAVTLAFVRMHTATVNAKRRAAPDAHTDRNKGSSPPAARLRLALANYASAAADDSDEADDLADALVAALDTGSSNRGNRAPGPLSGGACHLCGQPGHHSVACPFRVAPEFQAALRSYQSRAASSAANPRPPANAPPSSAARVLALEVFDQLQHLLDATEPAQEPSAAVHLLTSLAAQPQEDVDVLAAARRSARAPPAAPITRSRRAGSSAAPSPTARLEQLQPLPQSQGPQTRGQQRMPAGFPLRDLGAAAGDAGDLADGSQPLTSTHLRRKYESCLQVLSTATSALVEGVQEPLSALLPSLLAAAPPSPPPSTSAHLLDATICQPLFVQGLRVLLRASDGEDVDLSALGAEAIFDSGAGTSLISPRLVDRHPSIPALLDDLRQPFRVNGVTPGAFVPQRALELSLQLPGLQPVSHTFSLAASRQTTWDLLVGRDFLQRLRRGGISYTGDDGVDYVFPFTAPGDTSPQGARPDPQALPENG